ncbi:MAG: glycosyltransferase [Candidatus Saccharimonadaceae bacterium]
MNELINITESLNSSDPIVSIVCTAFNQKDFIKDTLEGFLIQQTTFPIEIIIHDDASTDGTTIIIKNYEAKYPYIIKPIYQNENQYSKKVDISKEFIFPQVRGKYIAICEGDDYWIDPLKLQKQVDFLEENNDYGLVYTDINRINQHGDLIDKNFLSKDGSYFCESFEDYLIYAPFRAPCTWVFRKSLYYENSKKYMVGDLLTLLDIAASSKIHFLSDITANYRVLSESASHFTNLKHTYAFMKDIYKIQMDYALKYRVSSDIKNTIKTKFALDSYNFAVTQHDIAQIKIADKLLLGNRNLTYKFKVIQLLSKCKLGRELVRFRLNRRLGYS